MAQEEIFFQFGVCGLQLGFENEGDRMSNNDNLTYGVVETMGDDVFIIFFQSTLNKSKQNDIANLRFFLQTAKTFFTPHSTLHSRPSR